MKRPILRKLLVFVLAAVMVAGILPDITGISAASKPKKPKITVTVDENGSSVTVTIGKTKRAEGYQVMAKLPEEEEYTEIETLELSGKKKRTYTMDNLAAGDYSVKVRAYKNASGKKVWGKYSEVSTFTIKASYTFEPLDVEQARSYVKTNYPKLYALYEAGTIDFSAEHENNIVKRVYVKMGSFEYEGEKKTIEWQLLDYDEKEGKALLLSKNILEDRVLNDSDDLERWEDSTLRGWLDSEFYKDTFSSEEKLLILQSSLENGEDNPKTLDRVFLLSESELGKCLADAKDRVGYYFDNEAGYWWLRTFSYYDDDFGVDLFKIVTLEGDTVSDFVTEDETGVRPAMYINLNFDKNALIAPMINLTALRQDKKIDVRIETAINADGYYIYMKSEADHDYKKIAELKQSTSEYLDYSVTDLEPGDYSFKVTAYRKNGKKTEESEAVLSEVRLNEREGVKTQTDEYKTVDATAFVKENYPGVAKLYDNGLISLKGERKADTIVLGSYELEYGAKKKKKYQKTEKQPLEWEVLEYSADGKKALVISKYIIRHIEFDKKGKLTWEKCSLRAWLNSEFYNNAFSAEEQELIRSSIIVHEDETLASKDTEDKIFIISESEAYKYYDDRYDRIATFVDGVADYWWLREANRSKDYFAGWDWEDYEDYEEDAHVVVRDYGIIDDGDSSVDFDIIGVRPSFWIDLNDEIIEANNLSVKEDAEPVVEKAYVLFGSSNDKENTPIEWEILEYDEKNGRVLLISRYVIEERKYASSVKKSDWAKSALCSYLNKDFLKKSFTDKEQALIATVTVDKKEEKVYILSLSEYNKYLGVKDYKEYDKDEDLAIYNAMSRDANGDTNNIWLRTNGAKTKKIQEYLYDGSVYKCSPTEESGVRPVLWLNIK